MALREFGVIPHVKMGNELKFLLSKLVLNYCSSTSFAIALKVSASGRKRNFSDQGKCPNLFMRIRLRTRGKLMLTNVRLKIRAV